MDINVLCAWQLERHGYKCFVLFVREVRIQMFCALRMLQRGMDTDVL